MVNLDNIIEASLGANVIQGVYNGFNDQKGISDIDDSRDVINQALSGKATDSQQAGRNAGQAISIAQSVVEKAGEMRALMEQIEESAQDLADAETEEEKDAILAILEDLAKEMSKFEEDTEVGGSKFFSEEGEDISISIGNGSSITIETPESNFDITNFDLTSQEGAEAMLKKIQEASKKSAEYESYAETQLGRLEHAENIIEYDVENEMGVDTSDIDEEYVNELVQYAADKVIEDMTVLFESQAQIEPDVAAKLLGDEIS